jgi:PucR C-terminal helix-turn-helix domain/GGDEF-like domain
MHSNGGLVGDVRVVVVVGRVRARRDELVRAILLRVRSDAFERTGDEDVEYLAGLRGAVVGVVDYALEGIERGEGWSGPVPVVACEQARRAARVGVSLETVLRRYVVGHTLLVEFVLEEAERGGLPDERGVLRGALRAQALVLDRLLVAITSEYEDELVRAGRSPERRLLGLVRGLLAGEHADDGGGAGDGSGGGVELGNELGYELAGEHVGVIARGVDAREALRALAGGLDRRLLCVECDERTVWAWLGGRHRLEMAVLERALAGVGQTGVLSSREGLDDGVGRGVLLAAGEPARGYAGWRLTHQQAQAALVVALRRHETWRVTRDVGRGRVVLTRYADVALLASALKDEMLGRALIETYLSPLDDSHSRGRVLRQTLRAYLAAEHNASSAAAILNVTRHTIQSRLRTIEQTLGRELHTCLAEIEIALRLQELNNHDNNENSSDGDDGSGGSSSSSEDRSSAHVNTKE